MKNTKLLLFLVIISFSSTTFAQKKINNKEFTGAEANLKSYNALYIINQGDDKKIKGVIRNINNALNDPRLKGKLKVELVAYGDGVEMFKKSNHYDSLLLKLQERGVILAECLNTIHERKISKDELWPFISFVPSGNGEIIIRHYQGWATVQP